jgi:hypothetical protein
MAIILMNIWGWHRFFAIKDDTAIDWVRFSWLIPDDLPGDFDWDGDVDGADFLLWQTNPAVGDLADWEANYGTFAPMAAAASAVPEPSTLGLATTILCAIVSRRRNTKHL